MTGVDEGVSVLPSAAKDIVSHQLAGPGIVQHGAALARGAAQFIDQGDVFLGGHSWLAGATLDFP